MPSEMTGTAFNFVLKDVPCLNCGQTNKQPIKELFGKRTTTCAYCTKPVDLKDVQASIAEFARDAQEVTFKVADPS